MGINALSEKTHRNGYGIGSADFTTEKVYRALDRDAMYINALTCEDLIGCKVPCALENERIVIQACIKTCAGIGPDGPRIIRIPNTLQLEEIQVSANYAAELAVNPRVEIQGSEFALAFDEAEALKN